ncbi:hypothetical protein WR25_17091 [Diploscapter pachys]|uniref:Cilia- and flagella-associated protein 36 n=1 Tax=Diploscapter pachys TaxID=2018661 RepID=A0A2A2JA22_9BILA|nr:hypothetical protein WR25_17091 [Diploscapter pachys]
MKKECRINRKASYIFFPLDRAKVFDRQQGDEKLYKEIHAEFASLIDTLISCFCEDMEVTTEKLAEALQELSHQMLTVKERVALEPIAAAQDFRVFVPMMMRKNVELQLQALQMIEFMCGLIPNILQLEEGETLRNMKEMTPEVAERWVLISVMRQSKEEFERSCNRALRDQLEDIAKEGLTEKEKLEKEKELEEAKLKAAIGETNNVPISYADAVTSITSGEARNARPPSRWKQTVDARTSASTAPILIALPVEDSNAKDKTDQISSTDETLIADTQRPRSMRNESGDKAHEDHSEQSQESDDKRYGTQTKSRSEASEATKMPDKLHDQIENTQHVEDGARPKSKRAENAEKSTSDGTADRPVSHEEKRSSSSKKKSRGNTSDTMTINASEAGFIPDAKKADGDKSRQSTANEHRPRSKERVARKDSRESAPVGSRTGSSARRNSLQSRQKKIDDEKQTEEKERKRLNSLKLRRQAGPKQPLPQDEDRLFSPGAEHGPRRRNLSDVNSLLKDGPRLNSADVASRAAYLKEQRDKLLALKMKERQKQINELTAQIVSERPRTAKAVRGAMRAEEEAKTKKAIAQKLKNEIKDIQIETIHDS